MLRIRTFSDWLGSSGTVLKSRRRGCCERTLRSARQVACTGGINADSTAAAAA